MKGVAHISFVGGGCIMPSATPYERETLIQHIESTSRLHGTVRVHVDRQDWLISRSAAIRAVCVRCQRQAGAVTYRFGGAALCTGCARRALQ